MVTDPMVHHPWATFGPPGSDLEALRKNPLYRNCFRQYDIPEMKTLLISLALLDIVLSVITPLGIVAVIWFVAQRDEYRCVKWLVILTALYAMMFTANIAGLFLGLFGEG